jgi:dephospho-CoA kinase
MNYDRPFLIAVTGGIAGGKTLVSNWFANNDIPVFYTDKLAHDVLDLPKVISKLKDVFGDDIFYENKVDRSRLGKIIFGNESLRKQLNSIIHPQVLAKMNEIIMLAESNYLIFEIPLLFELGLQNAFDLTINISARSELRIKRILNRDGISQDEAKHRIASQMSEFDKQKLTDINIANEGEIDELYNKLQNLLTLIKKLKKKEVKKVIEI